MDQEDDFLARAEEQEGEDAQMATAPGGAPVGPPPPPAEDRVTEIKGDYIDKLLDQWEAGELGCVRAADLADMELTRLKHAIFLRLAPALVGVDPANRGGLGCSAGEVHLLLEDIIEAGFSPPATSHAACMEERPGATALEDFNKELVAAQDLAPVEPHTLRYGSLSCSHTNMGLRALAAGVPSDHALLSEDGRLSAAKVRKRDRPMAEACEQGLRWRCYRWHTRVWYPRLPALIVEARNVVGGTTRRKSDAEGLALIHGLAGRGNLAGSASNPPDWVAIQAAAIRHKPPWAELVAEMCLFVAAKSGGTSGEHLHYYQALPFGPVLFCPARPRAGPGSWLRWPRPGPLRQARPGPVHPPGPLGLPAFTGPRSARFVARHSTGNS